MKIYQSGIFKRKVRKFSRNQKTAIDNEIRKIAQDPTIGIEKKGDLKGVFIHKFRISKVMYLLSYRFIGDDLELITIGSHENYYRDLKTYLNER